MKDLLNQITKRVGELIEPRLQWNIEELNLIKEISLSDNKIVIRIELIEDDFKKREVFKTSVLDILKDFPVGEKDVRIDKVDVSSHSLKNVGQIILVGSGKGGVGKSTVAVNLAATLCQREHKVGILDADVYGPSIPLLLGSHEKPQVIDQEMLMPITAHGMKMISIGNLFPREKAIAWRGQLVSGTILQFLRKVNWGHLDYLIVDLPPGTGDVHMTITKEIKPDGVIIVSTPQHVAREDVMRCISMFNDLEIPIIGILENMSSWVCEQCCHVQPIFTGSPEPWGNLKKLGSLPLERKIWDCSEKGIPYVKNRNSTVINKAFNRIADILENNSNTSVKAS